MYRNRQDAIEAIDIAARGKVKVVFKTHGLSALKETYEALEAGTIAGPSRSGSRRYVSSYSGTKLHCRIANSCTGFALGC